MLLFFRSFIASMQDLVVRVHDELGILPIQPIFTVVVGAELGNDNLIQLFFTDYIDVSLTMLS